MLGKVLSSYHAHCFEFLKQFCKAGIIIPGYRDHRKITESWLLEFSMALLLPAIPTF